MINQITKLYLVINFLNKYKTIMKKAFFLILILVITTACEQEAKNYLTFSGKITNKNSDSLVIRNRTYSKVIKVDEKGVFKDTLKVESGLYNMFDGKKISYLFLKNGDDIKMTLDAEKFNETISFTGKGSETSNYLAKKVLLQQNNFSPKLFELEEDAFKTKIAEINKSFSELLDSAKNIDSTIFASEKNSLGQMHDGLMRAYTQQKQKANKYAELTGKPSPNFVNYENYKGGTTSLSELKGKYVYIDIWATWCRPCIVEFPALKRIEKKYHGKNIEFVSISVDNGRGYNGETIEIALEASKKAWKKMIAEKQLGGIQLFSDKSWASEFVRGYSVNGIPRFILIDPAGNIVNADAPRPSNPKLIEIFDTLKI